MFIDTAMLLSSIFTAYFAFLINIPCGFIREGHPKFSLKWLLWIHASIPALIYLRVVFELPSWFALVSIFFAIGGQILGSRARRQRMTPNEINQRNCIPDLNFSQNSAVDGSKVLVALLNMGGPVKNSKVKDFQKRLFEDSRLIRFPLSAILQKPFAWLIVKLRLKAVEAIYMKMGGGSPIYKSTTRQARALRQELARRGHKIDVTFSFNYSPPLPEQTIAKAKALQKEYLLPLSLYPHYSKATTGSNLFYLQEAAKKELPALKFVPHTSYHLHDGYIQAFVDRIREQIKPNESLDDYYLMFSAHGLPLYFLTEGDPYPFLISQTVGRILGKLNREQNWIISYQSAVGPFEWLKPATDHVLHVLADKGIKKILVVPVAFVGDHIETICEINMEYRHMAESLGITDYRMSNAIETHPGFIQALADTVERALKLNPSNSSVHYETQLISSNH